MLEEELEDVPLDGLDVGSSEDGDGEWEMEAGKLWEVGVCGWMIETGGICRCTYIYIY